ncbi:polyphosphate polymerase domain-containing protein [Agromyces larvae]|uniref:Polyphosphate polymerase domain-containing protein n=1 Tax=Agromyces larvae TaxID=2929802 RepID=A0ABY4BVM3_9MICO|nr:polyphosphate polymerase domain-containing protein [Agromyces larvae]UOE42954.1 polyphosphate polymerase domain-containing protein [Agromyces larvae]
MTAVSGRERAFASLATLAPVSLDELNTRAELLTRVDRKYLLPLADLPRVLDRLPAGTLALEIDGARAQRYESVYFDTADLVSFTLAARGRRRRFKVRTRSYLGSDLAFLEVKTRGGRAVTVKDRVAVDPDATTALSGDGHAYARDVLDESGIGAPSDLHLDAVLTTRYRRATLLVPATGARPESRATVDLDLTWVDRGRGGSFPTVMTTPDRVIVETKSGASAGEVDHALWACGHRPTRISKYATGLAALRPGLPANRWHRVLARDFAGARREPANAPTTSS